MVDRLIKLKPFAIAPPSCLACGSAEVSCDKVLFPGTHIVLDCTCCVCQNTFYATLPVGHSTLFPVSFRKDGSQATYDPKAALWHALPLVKSMTSPPRIQGINIDLQTYSECRKIILLNCLDPCYGHSLYKLFHILHLREAYPDWGIAAIITPNLAWLLKGQVAEAWCVHVSAANTNENLTELNEFVNRQMDRFEEIAISKANFSNVFGKIDIYKLIPCTPFRLENYSRSPFRVTFVLREDRYWLKSKLLNWLFFGSNKYKARKYTNPLLTRRQNHLYGKVAKRIRKHLPEAEFYAVGLGNEGSLSGIIHDWRLCRPSEEDEHSWLRLYASSHLVIGIHGSGMILPSSLAAAFINIVPRYKIDHIAEETALVHVPQKLQQYLGRYVDEHASPELLAAHAVSMWRGTPLKWQASFAQYD